MHATRALALVFALTLSANLAWAQPDPPRLACSVLQARWEAAWPDSSRSRSLDENRQYSSGYRVGSPIDIDGGEPSSWHNLSFKLVNQPSPTSFYLNKVTGQIQTYSERFDHEQRSSYPLSVEAWLQGGPKNRKDPSGAQEYCNERFTPGCGDCRLQTITVNVSISDEPERPERPRAPRVSGKHGSLTVSWDQVETNPAINSYDVQWRAGTGGPFTNGPHGVRDTSATIENLDHLFNYRVRMRATNSFGDGDWSPTTGARTTPPLDPDTEPGDPDPEPEPEPEPEPDPEPDPDPDPPPGGGGGGGGGEPQPEPEPDPETDPEPEPEPEPLEVAIVGVPDGAVAGESYDLTAQSDEESLVYAWRVAFGEGGSVEPTDTQAVVWTAPSGVRVAWIRVDITREDGATAGQSAYVRVEAPEPAPPPEPPPPPEPVPALPLLGQLLLALGLLGAGAYHVRSSRAGFAQAVEKLLK